MGSGVEVERRTTKAKQQSGLFIKWMQLVKSGSMWKIWKKYCRYSWKGWLSPWVVKWTKKDKENPTKIRAALLAAFAMKPFSSIWRVFACELGGEGESCGCVPLWIEKTGNLGRYCRRNCVTLRFCNWSPQLQPTTGIDIMPLDGIVVIARALLSQLSEVKFVAAAGNARPIVNKSSVNSWMQQKRSEPLRCYQCGETSSQEGVSLIEMFSMWPIGAYWRTGARQLCCCRLWMIG